MSSFMFSLLAFVFNSIHSCQGFYMPWQQFLEECSRYRKSQLKLSYKSEIYHFLQTFHFHNTSLNINRFNHSLLLSYCSPTVHLGFLQYGLIQVMTIPLFFPVIFIIQNICLCDLSGALMVLMMKTFFFLVLIMISCCCINLLPLPEVHTYVSFLVSSLQNILLFENA